MAGGEATIYGGVVYEVKNFRYALAGRTMAEIELLCFGESFSAQARMLGTEDKFTMNIVKKQPLFFKTSTEALDAIIIEVEERIQKDPWFKEVEDTVEKLELKKV